MKINKTVIKKIIIISLTGLLLGFIIAITADATKFINETIQYNLTATSAAGEWFLQLTEIAKTPNSY